MKNRYDLGSILGAAIIIIGLPSGSDASGGSSGNMGSDGCSWGF